MLSTSFACFNERGSHPGNVKMDKTHNECNKANDCDSNNSNNMFHEEKDLGADEDKFGGLPSQGTHNCKAVLNVMRVTEAQKFNKPSASAKSLRGSTGRTTKTKIPCSSTWSPTTQRRSLT